MIKLHSVSDAFNKEKKINDQNTILYIIWGSNEQFIRDKFITNSEK